MNNSVPQIIMGLIFTAVGLGVGWLMYSHPEGLNPSWPLWVAEFAPGVFVLAGMFLVVSAAGFARLGMAILRILLICMLVVFNFAVFFTSPDECGETVSFLGIALFTRHPSPASCSIGGELIVGTLDLVIVLGFIAFKWQKIRASRTDPPRAN
jgi:hypothetical protein